jgi:hypothetical protein
LAVSIVGYTLGSFYPPELFTLVNARPAPPPPPSSSPEALALVAHLENELQRLPLIQSLRSAPDADEWYEVRPYQRFPAEKRMHSLTAGALAGAGRLALSPLVRARKDESESIVILHVGRSLCGHDGIIHGGLIATILDESMGRVVSIGSFLKVSSLFSPNESFLLGPFEFPDKCRCHCKPLRQLSRAYQSRSSKRYLWIDMLGGRF